jgi:hypothetical protein
MAAPGCQNAPAAVTTIPAAQAAAILLPSIVF